MEKTRVLIMGAAGRDFHNFNVRYRSDARYEVVAFTATQIPNIEGRRYPAELAGSLYPQGIPIHSEDELAELVLKLSVDEVVFSYSDVSHNPTVEIVVADPHRAGHELTYHPGEANLLRAQVIVINKMDSASKEGIQTLRSNIAASNPKAMVIEATSPLFVDDEEMIRGKKVLAIEDGPTITHGGMEFGAATLAAHRFGASELVDPRPHAVGSLRDTFEKYPHLGEALPAMGYGAKQIQGLEATINGSEAEVVLFATPVDLRRLVKLDKPALRVRYELQEIGEPNLKDALVSI